MNYYDFGLISFDIYYYFIATITKDEKIKSLSLKSIYNKRFVLRCYKTGFG